MTGIVKRSLHVTFVHLIKTLAQLTCVILCLPVLWAQFTIAGKNISFFDLFLKCENIYVQLVVCLQDEKPS